MTTIEARPGAVLPELRAGLLAVAPVAIAVVPIGLVYGAIAVQKGLSPLEVVLTSLLVFAGSAQFVALEFWRDPVPWLALTLTALTINLRHIMMGASISRHLGRSRGFSRYGWMFWLTDEAWALCERRALQRPLTPAFFAGVGLTLYVDWNATSLVGALLGRLIEDPAVYGFDFAFSALFIALVVGFWRGVRTAPVIAASAIVAMLTKPALGGAWYVIAGGIAGMLVAVVVALVDRQRIIA